METPRDIARQEFARRLISLMKKRGWHQSELARRSGIPRAAISTYVRGSSLPQPIRLTALARALNVEEIDILPEQIEDAVENERQPVFEMKTSQGAPDTAWVRVNKLVKLSTAVKIAALLEAEKPNGTTD